MSTVRLRLNLGRAMLQGHLERMLTSNATDIGAMLAGVREHHDTLVSALEGEPAAAASLADSGVLNALQVSNPPGSGQPVNNAQVDRTNCSVQGWFCMPKVFLV